MNTFLKFSFLFFGVILGLTAVFTVDMIVNRGEYVAHHFKRYQPRCSNECHKLEEASNGSIDSFGNGRSLLCWNNHCIYAHNWKLQR